MGKPHRTLNPMVGHLAFIFWDEGVGGSSEVFRQESYVIRFVSINNIINGLKVVLVGGRQVRNLLCKSRERIEASPKPGECREEACDDLGKGQRGHS